MRLTNAVSIIIESTGERIHSLDDWGLAITNNDYIKEPEQETSYITIPGASIDIDMSEAQTGHPVYKSREIVIEFGGVRERMYWDPVISDFRNKIEGRIVHLIFDNDKGYYWRGRAAITDFDRVRKLGTFKLEIPHADPFKYDVFSSNDPWEWDPFDFVNGVIRYIGPFSINNTTITVPKGNKLVVPIFEINYINGGNLTVTVAGKTYPLKVGENRFPQIHVAGEEEVSITFNGQGRGKVYYRGGSL